MANLAASAVTITEDGYCDGQNGRKYVFRKGTFILTAQGSTTNLIPAIVFNMRTLEYSFPVVKSDDSLVLPTAPDTLKANLLIAKNDGTGTPTDYTGTFSFFVVGSQIV